VLEDALDRSLALAAGMDTRGYGRAGELTPARRHTSGALMLAGLCGLCVGTYAVLDRTAPRVLALPMLAAGVMAALLGLAGAGSRVRRTRYRPDPWRLPEWTVAAAGAVAATIAIVHGRRDPLAAYPPLDAWPVLTLTQLVLAVVALLGGLSAPLPARARRPAPDPVAAGVP
jgi:energy-coupling factor transport system permease protein